MKPFKEVVLTLQSHNEEPHQKRMHLLHRKYQHKLKRKKTKKKLPMKMKTNLLRVKKKLKPKGKLILCTYLDPVYFMCNPVTPLRPVNRFKTVHFAGTEKLILKAFSIFINVFLVRKKLNLIHMKMTFLLVKVN